MSSAFYRLWSSARLRNLLPACLPTLPAVVQGGLPGVRHECTIVDLMAYVELAVRGSRVLTCGGISVDASKCFDRISWVHCLQVARQLGVPDGPLRGWAAMVLQQKRRTCLQARLDDKRCSVLLWCCVVASWHTCLGELARLVSCIDDRLILTGSEEELLGGHFGPEKNI